MECDRHKGHNVALVCSKCDTELVCSKCLVESHNGHHMKTLEEAEQWIKEKLQKQSSENSQIVFDLDKQLKNIEEVKMAQEVTADNTDKAINDRRTVLHCLVDETADYLLTECHNILKENIATLDEQSTNITHQKAKAREVISKIGQILNENTVVDVIMGAKEISRVTVENIPYIVPDLKEIQYVQDPIDEHKIKNTFGIVTGIYLDASKCSDFVQHVNPSVNINDSLTMQRETDVAGTIETKQISHEFQHSSSRAVSVLTAYDNGTCLVKCKDETEITLLSDEGHIYQRVNLTSTIIHGVAKSADGSILACSARPNCILKFTLPKAEVSTFCSTGNLEPEAIQCVSTGELVVTFSESANILHLFKKKHYFLMKYNVNGEEIAKVEKDGFNEDLFHGPFKVVINRAEDTVLVVNQESCQLRYLVVLDGQLSFKFRYLGEGSIIPRNEKFRASNDLHFYISDVGFDTRDNIVICEKFSKSVQLLSPSCDLLQVLFTDDVFSWSLAVTDDDKIWIGRDDGRIKVLE